MKKWKGLLFVLPSLIGVAVFYILPFISSFMYCFTTGVNERKFIGIHNFIQVFLNKNFRLAIRNTLFITGISLPLLCSLSLFMALVIGKNIKKYKWVQSILFIPLAMPAASLMLVWQDLFAQKEVVNQLFSGHIDWLNSSIAPLIVIFLIIWKNLGYNIILIMGALLSMPKEYEEAASLDGANFWQIALHIQVPHLIPVLFFVLVISLSNSFKIFREVYLLQGDYPHISLYLLQHFMNNNFANLDYEILSTAAFLLYIVIFIIIFGLSYLQQQYIKNNV